MELKLADQEEELAFLYRIREHLLTQKARSLNAKGLCSYRGKSGMACALGCLIAKQFYSTRIEGRNIGCAPSVEEDPVTQALQLSLDRKLSKEFRHVLGVMQALHDVVVPRDWEVACNILIDRYSKYSGTLSYTTKNMYTPLLDGYDVSSKAFVVDDPLALQWGLTIENALAGG